MLLTVHVKPGAKTSEITEWLDENTLKMAIAALPEKGKANKEVIRVLAREFGLAPSLIEIVRGKTTRIKQIRIPNNAR